MRSREHCTPGSRGPFEAAQALRLKRVDRLLDNLTSANRDFVDEKLAALRPRLREMEARQKELERMADGPLDCGLTAGIALHPSEHRGVVTCYRPPASIF